MLTSPLLMWAIGRELVGRGSLLLRLVSIPLPFAVIIVYYTVDNISIGIMADINDNILCILYIDDIIYTVLQ